MRETHRYTAKQESQLLFCAGCSSSLLPASDQRLGGFLDIIFNQSLVMSKPESENRPSLSFTPHEFFQGLIIASGQGFVCVRVCAGACVCLSSSVCACLFVCKCRLSLAEKNESSGEPSVCLSDTKCLLFRVKTPEIIQRHSLCRVRSNSTVPLHSGMNQKLVLHLKIGNKLEAAWLWADYYYYFIYFFWMWAD